jgi:hypothetical protein
MPEIPGLRESILRWAAIDQVKEPIVRALAKEFVNRPGRLKTLDVVIPDTPYGPQRVPGIYQPNEDRVYYALMPVIDLRKTGTGAKDWSFQWADEAAPGKKTAEEKLGEIGMFGVKQGVDKLEKKLKIPALGLAFEYASTGKVSPSSIVQTISEPVGEWVMEDVLVLSAEVVGKALPIIGWVWLAYDIAELAMSLGEPPEKELSPYQQESANIVADVKGYLERKSEAARRAEERKQQRFFYNLMLPNNKTGVDKTAVDIRRF